MNTPETDKRFQNLIKGVRLESPGPDFTARVMETILSETQKKPVYVTEPILGKGFWILVIPFITLAAIFVIVQGADSGTGTLQQMFSKIPEMDWTPYRNLLSGSFFKTGSMLWTLIIVVLGASGLIFADKIFTGKRPLCLN